MKRKLNSLLGKEVKIISYFEVVTGILCFFDNSKQYDTFDNKHYNKLFFTVDEISSINGNIVVLK